MADEQFHKDLLAVLAKHGVGGLAAASPAALAKPGGAVASYIKEIITGDQAFDENVLARVTKVLNPK